MCGTVGAGENIKIECPTQARMGGGGGGGCGSFK